MQQLSDKCLDFPFESAKEYSKIVEKALKLEQDYFIKPHYNYKVKLHQQPTFMGIRMPSLLDNWPDDREKQIYQEYEKSLNKLLDKSNKYLIWLREKGPYKKAIKKFKKQKKIIRWWANIFCHAKKPYMDCWGKNDLPEINNEIVLNFIIAEAYLAAFDAQSSELSLKSIKDAQSIIQKSMKSSHQNLFGALLLKKEIPDEVLDWIEYLTKEEFYQYVIDKYATLLNERNTSSARRAFFIKLLIKYYRQHFISSDNKNLQPHVEILCHLNDVFFKSTPISERIIYDYLADTKDK